MLHVYVGLDMAKEKAFCLMLRRAFFHFSIDNLCALLYLSDGYLRKSMRADRFSGIENSSKQPHKRSAHGKKHAEHVFKHFHSARQREEKVNIFIKMF